MIEETDKMIAMLLQMQMDSVVIVLLLLCFKNKKNMIIRKLSLFKFLSNNSFALQAKRKTHTRFICLLLLVDDRVNMNKIISQSSV